MESLGIRNSLLKGLVLSFLQDVQGFASVEQTVPEQKSDKARSEILLLVFEKPKTPEYVEKDNCWCGRPKMLRQS